jgi:hypothetical protein
MVLLDDIVEVLHLVDDDCRAVRLVVPWAAAELVPLRSMVIVSGTLWRRSALMRKCWAICWSQWEVSREAMMWPCFSTAWWIPPLPRYTVVGLIQAPAERHQPFVAVERLWELGTIFEHPAIDGRMVDGNTKLLHEFLYEFCLSIVHCYALLEQFSVQFRTSPQWANHARASASVTVASARVTASSSASRVRALAARKHVVIVDQHGSLGLRSGAYGGQ